MPYKCTACNKSFRYKVSERTHKCTAQPPGVVVRTQANLVERLQAAMIKAAEKNEKKLPSEEMEHQGLHMSCSPKSDTKNVTQNKSPVYSQVDKSPLTFHSTDGNKCLKDKPQYYLLVKGPNDESYYQPVIVPQTPSSKPKRSEKKEKHSKDRTKLPENSIKIAIPESNSGDKNLINNDHSVHVVLKSPESMNSSSSSSFLDSPASNNQSIHQDFLYCSILNSPKDKRNSTADSEIFTMVIDTNEKKILPSSNTDEKLLGDRKLLPIKSFDHKKSTESNYESERCYQYVGTSFPDKRKKLEFDNSSEKENSLHAPISESKPEYSPPADILMDSTDIFSLILSPALSSPSDKFGRLTLSPSSNPSTSFNICGFEKQNLLSDNLNCELDIAHDPLFENISDDALKEFLFGSEMNK